MAIASMTGFARKEGGNDQFSWTWEVKSVNNRGMDVRLRLPPGHDALDLQIRKGLKDNFARGSFSVNLNLKSNADQMPVQVNREFLDELILLADELLDDGSPVAEPRLDGLLRVRGVVDVPEFEESEDDREARHKQLHKEFLDVLKSLQKSRLTEGKHLEQILVDHINTIEDLTNRAADTGEARLEAVKAKLSDQVAMLLEAKSDLPEERLAQELAVIATKIDVREEIDRLRAHISTARDMLKKGGVCGRKLDFLTQEFNREANTLCSKANAMELTQIGLDLKTVIDQVREQVQNVE